MLCNFERLEIDLRRIGRANFFGKCEFIVLYGAVCMELKCLLAIVKLRSSSSTKRCGLKLLPASNSVTYGIHQQPPSSCQCPPSKNVWMLLLFLKNHQNVGNMSKNLEIASIKARE